MAQGQPAGSTGCQKCDFFFRPAAEKRDVTHLDAPSPLGAPRQSQLGTPAPDAGSSQPSGSPPIGSPLLESRSIQGPESMSPSSFWSSYSRPLEDSRPHLILGGTRYPVIDSDDLAAGYTEVDVMLNDDHGRQIGCVIVAGLVGVGFSSSRDTSLSFTGKNDTVRKVVGWWIYSKLEEAEHQAEGALRLEG
ncbi:hypothetical protein B0H19DRAFT_1377637 [Mycena capillaripes]|nr:hypothetical protein B0H19DRAFT_1377637 [Mycena capillaripes]